MSTIRVDLPKNTEVVVSGVLAFQNRGTSVVYWVKEQTVEYGVAFTTHANEKELGLGGVDIHFKSSSKCFIVVEK